MGGSVRGVGGRGRRFRGRRVGSGGVSGGDHHHGRAHDAAEQLVAGLQHLDHAAGRHVAARSAPSSPGAGAGRTFRRRRVRCASGRCARRPSSSSFSVISRPMDEVLRPAGPPRRSGRAAARAQGCRRRPAGRGRTSGWRRRGRRWPRARRAGAVFSASAAKRSACSFSAATSARSASSSASSSGDSVVFGLIAGGIDISHYVLLYLVVRPVGVYPPAFMIRPSTRAV